VRRHLTYANVVATLALVLAMSGAAAAARPYFITSTSQIAPDVLSELRGNTGATGATGPAGGGPEVNETTPGVISLRWPEATVAGELAGISGASVATGASGPTGEPGEP
jgi:hypothetical protein